MDKEFKVEIRLDVLSPDPISAAEMVREMLLDPETLRKVKVTEYQSHFVHMVDPKEGKIIR